MKELTLVQLITKFESIFGDIRSDKKLWVSTYNKYMDRMGWRFKVEVESEKYIHDGRVLVHKTYEYQYSKWGAWDWEAYEYYSKIPNHTRTCEPMWLTLKQQAETDAM